MRRPALASIVSVRRVGVLVGLTSLAGTLLTGVVATTAAFASNPSIESQFINDMNVAREQHGLRPYSVASDLTTNAREQSDRMAVKGTIWDDPNVGGEVCCWQSIGENTGMGPTEPDIQTAFMNSPPHRANILDPSFTQVGVGVTVGSNGAIYVTEVFRQPMGASAPPPPPAPAPAPVSAPPAPSAPVVSAPPPPSPVHTNASSWSGPVTRSAPRHTVVPRVSPTAWLRSKIRQASAMTSRAAVSDPLAAALTYLNVMSVLAR